MNTIRRTGIILLLLIMLPAAVFTWFELSSLSSSEEMIQKIYNNQLDAILYSVNQYSEDIVSSCKSKIESGIEKQNLEPGQESSGKKLFQEINPSIDFFFTADSSGKIKSFFGNSHITASEKELMSISSSAAPRLLQYEKAGYNKYEPVKIASLNNITVVLSVMSYPYQNKICGIGINSEDFIKDVLAAKVRSISQTEFIISIFKIDTKQNIYSTAALNGNIKNSKQLWLLPDYAIGISLQGGTIQDYVRSRTETNLILILIVVILLLAGFWFVFRSIKKEVQLAQMKSEFVSNVSHELRTPLALISMYAETLELGRARTEEKKNEYYSIISHEAGRLGKIVNRILNFSQLEAGKRKFSFAAVDVNEIVDKVYRTYQFHLQNSGFKFSFIPEDNLPEINADKEAVAEAVVNLIDNAVKYSAEDKQVEISTGRIGDMVFIKVKDCGIGIPEDDQKKIFDKFFRVSSGNVHNTKGTGLGLTLVKHIVEAHKGEITLNSKPGKGSSFILKFRVFNS